MPYVDQYAIYMCHLRAVGTTDALAVDALIGYIEMLVTNL